MGQVLNAVKTYITVWYSIWQPFRSNSL